MLRPDQQAALAAMDKRNLGAVLTALGWTWPADVRRDVNAAVAVLLTLGLHHEGASA